MAAEEKTMVGSTKEDVRIRTTPPYEICDPGAAEKCIISEQTCSVNPHQ